MAEDSISEEDKARKRAKNRECARRKYNTPQGKAYAQQWQKENRLRINAYNREYRKRTPRREWEREWENKNRDKINASKRARRAKDVEKTRSEWREEARRRRAAVKAAGFKRDRSWEKNNKDKVRAIAALQKAKRKGAEGSFAAADIAAIRTRQRDRCAYCRKPLRGKGHIDHIVSIAKGGSNWPRNLQLACAVCNATKYTSDPIDFAQRLGLLL